MKVPHFDTDRAYAELMDAGNAWADALAAADLLDECRLSVLSECKLLSDEKSDAARETEARASTRFKGFLSEMIEARRIANRAKVKYDTLKTLAEMRRTEESTRRAELNFVRGGGAG